MGDHPGLPALPGVQQVKGVQVRLQAQMDQQGIQARLQEFTASTIPAQVDLHTLQGAFQKVGGVMRVDGLRLEMDIPCSRPTASWKCAATSQLRAADRPPRYG